MKSTTSKILILAVALALLTLAACSDTAASSSSAAPLDSLASEPPSSAMAEPEPSVAPPASSNAASYVPSSSSISSSAASNSQSESGPSSASNQPEASQQASSAPEAELIPIEPDEDIPVGEPPQPERAPQFSAAEILDELNQNEVYIAGRIMLSRVHIDGTTDKAIITKDTEKRAILGFIDSMQTSEYDTNDVPPGGGGIISVAIHRNDVIEHYSLTDETVDDNALARNLQAPDIYKWSIVNEDAFPYAESLLLHYAN